MPDRIEKSVRLDASLARVWAAVSDSAQFGRWFGVAFDAPFVAGRRLTGRLSPTEVDPEVAAMQQPHAGKTFVFEVESIEPMRRIAFRWHPFAHDETVDYSGEPMTLIVFELEQDVDAVLLRITESGFDRIPLARRAEAFKANDFGWTKQAELVAKYLRLHGAR